MNTKSQFNDADIINLASAIAEKLNSNIIQLSNSNECEKLNVSQAAEFLNRKKPTIYLLSSKGKLKTHFDGQRLYFLRNELQEYLDQKDHLRKVRIGFVESLVKIEKETCHE